MRTAGFKLPLDVFLALQTQMLQSDSSSTSSGVSEPQGSALTLLGHSALLHVMIAALAS